MLIPVLLLEAMKGGSRDAALSVKVAMGSILCLAPPLVWRLYVLVARPDLLGRYTEGTRDAGAGSSGTNCKWTLPTITLPEN